MMWVIELTVMLIIITAPDKILRDNAFNIPKVQNLMGINEVLLQWFINVLSKKSSLFAVTTILVIGPCHESYAR